jgi:hypothetical protein
MLLPQFVPLARARLSRRRTLHDPRARQAGAQPWFTVSDGITGSRFDRARERRTLQHFAATALMAAIRHSACPWSAASRRARSAYLWKHPV